MAKRSKVELYEQIRKTREREQLGIRALARRFGVHRRDVHNRVVDGATTSVVEMQVSIDHKFCA